MQIEVYEWPLPAETSALKTVVFELACPRWFASWRDSTWKLLHDFGQYERGRPADSKQGLLAYRKIEDFRATCDQRLSLGSTTKSWRKAHYSHLPVPVEFDQLSVPNGFDFSLLDTMNNVWIADQSEHPTLKPRCTFTVPTGPYSALEYAIRSFGHTENEVIAGQRKCHSAVSL